MGWVKMFAIILFVGLASCGGGGDGVAGADPCTTLKIAGGSSCSAAPGAIAIVATDRAYCSGTFITPRHVLTAAHCFTLTKTGVTVVGPNYRINASKIATHPRYNPALNSDEFDVAVVTLAKSVAVIPVPLLLSQAPRRGDTVVSYGFGLDEDGKGVLGRINSSEAPLKATTLEVVSVTDFSVTTLSDGSGDTCQGDSGGALIGTNAAGARGIVAIVRAGPALCEADSGLPSDNTNTQVQSIVDFVVGVAPGVPVI